MARTIFHGGRVFDGTGSDPGDLGTIEAGKIADLVLVDGDPYDVAALPERVVGVWKDGARAA